MKFDIADRDWPVLALSIAAPIMAVMVVLVPFGLPIVAAAAALCALYAAWRLKQPLIAPWHLAALLALLVMWSFLTVFWSAWPANVYSTLIRTVPITFGAGVLLTAALRMDANEAWRVGRALIGAAMLLAVLALIETLSGGFLFRSRDALLGRVPYWTYPIVSQALVVLALLAWPAAIVAWRRGAAWPAGALLAVALAVPFTADHVSARGAMLIGLVVLAVVWWGGRLAVAAIGALMGAIIAAAPLLPLGPLNPSVYVAWLPGMRNSAMHRLYIWQFTADRVWEHPFLGWGLDASRNLPGGDQSTPVGGTLISLHPHNVPLQLWVELGPVGVAAVLGLLAVAIVGVARLSDDRFTRAAAMSLIVAATFVSSVSFGAWQSWWLASLALIACWTIVAVKVPLATAAVAAPKKRARAKD
ncbi:MAG: O-antigen ligase family protein [Alphaproteobacteria bacterium]|jgi:O-antigen ligase|nr:O-antigen ligase family protein [Alphaproteobacteria bacterium]